MNNVCVLYIAYIFIYYCWLFRSGLYIAYMYLKSVHKQADHEIDVEIFLKIIKTKKKKNVWPYTCD